LSYSQLSFNDQNFLDKGPSLPIFIIEEGYSLAFLIESESSSTLKKICLRRKRTTIFLSLYREIGGFYFFYGFKYIESSLE